MIENYVMHNFSVRSLHQQIFDTAAAKLGLRGTKLLAFCT